MFSDLHIHSRYSDGRLSPKQLIELASLSKIEYLAIADHDCIDGIKEAILYGQQYKINVIPAVEFSCVIENVSGEVHILGYIKNYEDKNLKKLLKYFADARKKRIEGMIKILGELGIEIDYEKVIEISGDGTVGRPHIARAIFESGATKNIGEAFHKYLVESAPAYLPKASFSVEAAISAIHRADGFAVWAHPHIQVLREYIQPFKKAGLDGIEAYHPRLTRKDSTKLRKIARRSELFITGGSDWHSEQRDGKFGSFLIETENVAEFLTSYFKASR
jgi:hypothetical protein